MSYYAVAKGKNVGIYTTWAECEKNIKGYSGAKYKKFKSKEEAEAFIETFSGSSTDDVIREEVIELYAVIIAPDGLIDIMKKEELDEINKNYPIGITSEVKSRQEAIDYFKSNTDIYDFYIERFVENNKLFDETVRFAAPEKKEGSPHSNIIISEKTPMEDSSVLTDKEAIVYVDGSYKEDLNDFTYGIVIINSDGDEIEYSGKSLSHERSLKEMRNVSGELKGTIVAIKKAIELGFEKIYLHYDYQGIESWVTGEWKAKKEGTKMYRDTIHFLLQDITIEFIKVKGHAGIKYNERVDQLAAQAYFDY